MPDTKRILAVYVSVSDPTVQAILTPSSPGKPFPGILKARPDLNEREQLRVTRIQGTVNEYANPRLLFLPGENPTQVELWNAALDRLASGTYSSVGAFDVPIAATLDSLFLEFVGR
jgi:hypothetical protein